MYFIIYLTIIIWWYRKCYCFPSINFAELGTVPHVGKRKISHFETGECKIHGQHLICCFQECSARCGSGTDKNEPIEGQVESLLVKDGFGSDCDGYGFSTTVYHILIQIGIQIRIMSNTNAKRISRIRIRILISTLFRR